MGRDVAAVRLRNFGIMAHVDAGKTTLSERILFLTGAIHRVGTVDGGDTTMDFTAVEKRRGITVNAAATSTWWSTETGTYAGQKHRLNLIDTPGHVDFTIEVERSLRVLDGAVAVLDAARGVEPQSETVWKQADRYGVPRLVFVNKMDRPGADPERCMHSLRERLHVRPVAVQLPLGVGNEFVGGIDLVQFVLLTEGTGPHKTVPEAHRAEAERARLALVEACSEFSDAVLEQYLSVGAMGVEASLLSRTLREATRAGALVPVLFGAAFQGLGIRGLLDAVVDWLPSPLDVPSVKGHREDGSIVETTPDEREPLRALVFKIAADPFVGVVAFARVFSGTLRAGQPVRNATEDTVGRVGRIYCVYAEKREEVQEAHGGSIVAISGLKEVRSGHSLCPVNEHVVLEAFRIPEPVVELAIEPRTRDDSDRLSLALQRLALEDPSLRIASDPEAGSTLLRGMGELHLEVLLERMRDEAKVEVNVGPPRVAYREAIARKAVVEHKHIRQRGGTGQYGHVVLEVSPLERGGGFVFEDATVGGVIPKEFVPSIRKGVEGAMARGVLAGYPVVDVRVRLLDGSYHREDSSGPAFEIAASQAFQQAARAAGLHLLEPLMAVEITTPETALGSVLGDAASRRGQVRGMEQRGVDHVVNALVPMAELFGYVPALRARSQGRASASMHFDHYERVPTQREAALLQELRAGN